MFMRVFGCPPHLGMRTNLWQQQKRGLSSLFFVFDLVLRYAPIRLREIKAITATNKAEPMIDHSTGKVFPSTLTGKGSGSPNWRASHMPISAPMKPTAIEVRQPPVE